MNLLPIALSLWLQASDVPKPVDLWPTRPPGDPEGIEEKVTPGERGPKRVDSTGRPSYAVYSPAKDRNTGAAIVVAPGGGYRMLAFEHEGTQVGEWLASIGVTAVLLKYRVPQRPGDSDNQAPLQDAQRAISITRSRAAEWGVAPTRIGILGFSAGGHLAANAETNYDRRAYDAVDDADKASCRPDFAVLIYPGGVLDRQDREKLSAQMRITKETPPTFLAVSADDKGSAPGTIKLFQALRDAGVSAELHVFASGGHGWGMRKSDQTFGGWTARCEEWMRSRGLLQASAAAGGK